MDHNCACWECNRPLSGEHPRISVFPHQPEVCQRYLLIIVLGHFVLFLRPFAVLATTMFFLPRAA